MAPDRSFANPGGTGQEPRPEPICHSLPSALASRLPSEEVPRPGTPHRIHQSSGGRRRRSRWGLLGGVLLAISAAEAGGIEPARIDPRLTFMLEARRELARGSAGDLTAGFADPHPVAVADERMELGQIATALCLRIITLESFAGSIRFVQPPAPEAIAALEADGIGLRTYAGRVAGSRTVFPAEIPWSCLAALAADEQIAWIAPAWRVGRQRPLHQSRPQVQADQVWELPDEWGRTVTGKGRLIADFDTGVNYFHPALFHADGDTLDWIDVDLSGDLTPGDAVDINGNGLADPGESLRYEEALGAQEHGNDPDRYNPSFDWLYNDSNDNGVRDFGAQFGEEQPGYGERLFVALDANQNDRLDVGERLVTLGTSKVRAVRGRDGSVAVRGENLLSAELDYYGHGTQVSGILCGGWPGINRMSGIAPDAELIHGINDYTDEAPFLLGLEDHLAWAAGYQPDAFLVEDGEWVWEFMDGSSNAEIMLNEYAADQNILAVVPAGNLATGRMHTRFASNSTASLHIASNATVAWASFLWTQSPGAQVALLVPGGLSDYLELDGSTQSIGAYEVYSLASLSPRGTHRVDVRLEHESPGTSLNGEYVFLLEPDTGSVLLLHGYFYDNHSGWYSASTWGNVHMDYTVTWPATADSAISVAAYNPSGDGNINAFSGWGPRIDERPNVDIAAPGSTVTTLHPFHQGGYANFGGTSSAGPHVAAAAALMRQMHPGMDSGEFRVWLRLGAQNDQYTGNPNRWGAGKLRILDALGSVSDAPGWPGGSAGPGPGVQASPVGLEIGPNPAWDATILRFTLPADEGVLIRIVDLQGRQVRQWTRAAGTGRSGQVVWDTRDAQGRPVASGIYMARVEHGSGAAARRVTILR